MLVSAGHDLRLRTLTLARLSQVDHLGWARLNCTLPSIGLEAFCERNEVALRGPFYGCERKIEDRRHGFSYAGSAAAQGVLPVIQSSPIGGDSRIGKFARENSTSHAQAQKQGIPTFRVTVNDRLQPNERFVTIAHELGHIFCGHLGACTSRSGKDEESGWPDRRLVGYHEKELEAEATAYLVASRAGLVTRSAAYLKTHAKQANMRCVDLDLIVRAAARIERFGKIHHGSMAFRE